MKARGGSKIIEKNKIKRGVEKSKERRRVEYLAVGYKVVQKEKRTMKRCNLRKQ